MTTRQKIQLELLKDLKERFDGVHEEYYIEILDEWINDIEDPQPI